MNVSEISMTAPTFYFINSPDICMIHLLHLSKIFMYTYTLYFLSVNSSNLHTRFMSLQTMCKIYEVERILQKANRKLIATLSTSSHKEIICVNLPIYFKHEIQVRAISLFSPQTRTIFDKSINVNNNIYI